MTELADQSRRGVCVPWSQRGRQDHDHQAHVRLALPYDRSHTHRRLRPSAGLRGGEAASLLISYVPDQPFLYEKLTGREVLQFVADMYGMEPAHGRGRMKQMIDLFDLHPFIDDLTERYSHGMRQRTVFAAALLHEPKVLIVDEPTVGLDPINIRLLKDLLRQEAKSGATVFLSTQSPDIAEELVADPASRCIRQASIKKIHPEHLREQAEHGGSLEEVFLKLTREEVAQEI